MALNATPPPFDVEKVRADFPILSREIHGKPLAYLDNAATAQKPRQVIDALSHFLEDENANIHRGVHYLSVTATDSWDDSRKRVGRALGVEDADQIIFVRGATEGINLVAASWGDQNIEAGDEILITWMEHHANIVPWQLLAARKGATLKVAPVTDEGALDLEAWQKMITPKTKLAGFTHISNVLGTVNPVKEMCDYCRERGVVTVIDGAQASPHGPVNLTELGCDFYVFSGHKVFGPDGIGVLYGRRELLEKMPPWQGGGDMIERVSFEGTTYKGIPERFEAGTPNISGAIGLAIAFDYLESVGWDNIAAQEKALLEAATEALRELPGLEIQGTVPGKASVISFSMKGVHPHDIGTILDSEGVAVRGGNHCAQPLMERLGKPSTARASFAFYNNMEDVERLAKAVHKTHRFFC